MITVGSQRTAHLSEAFRAPARRERRFYFVCSACVYASTCLSSLWTVLLYSGARRSWRCSEENRWSHHVTVHHVLCSLAHGRCGGGVPRQGAVHRHRGLPRILRGPTLQVRARAEDAGQGMARQILLATSQDDSPRHRVTSKRGFKMRCMTRRAMGVLSPSSDAISLKKRSFKWRWTTWRAISGRPYTKVEIISQPDVDITAELAAARAAAAGGANQ